MKRIYLATFLLLSLLAAACKKKGEGGIGNAFTIGDKAYNTANTRWDPVNRTLIASDVLGNTVFIDFSTHPVTSKKYLIAPGLSIPDSNQVVVAVLRVADTTSYVSKGQSRLEATVMVNGNRIGIIVPYCDAYNPMHAGDVIQINASVQANNFSQD